MNSIHGCLLFREKLLKSKHGENKDTVKFSTSTVSINIELRQLQF